MFPIAVCTVLYEMTSLSVTNGIMLWLFLVHRALNCMNCLEKKLYKQILS